MSINSGKPILERYWLLFVLLSLLIRGVYVYAKVDMARSADEEGCWYFETPDTHSYFDPIDNLISDGHYSPDYRMPGVGGPYLMFRQFLSKTDSRDAMVVLQWLFSGISVYLLALTALRFTGSTTAAWTTYVFFLLSTYSSWYDSTMASDSLAPSVLIFHVFFFQMAMQRRSKWLLLIAGLFLAWIIFIRPAAILLIIAACVLVLLYWKPRRSFLAVAIFAAPFAVTDLAWTIRNWAIHAEFNPLTNEGMLPDEIAERTRGYLLRFVQSYGGNYIWWDPGAEIRWLGMCTGSVEVDDHGRKAKEPPSYVYVPGITKDSLLLLAERIRLIEAGALSPEDSTIGAAEVNAKLERYTELYQKGAPFNYHVLSRFRMIEHIVWQNGTETLFTKRFSELSLVQKLFKLLQMFFFIFAFGGSAVAILVLCWRWRLASNALTIWLPFIVAYMVLIYPLGLRMAEWRFMMHVFPLALMLAICSTSILGQVIYQYQLSKRSVSAGDPSI